MTQNPQAQPGDDRVRREGGGMRRLGFLLSLTVVMLTAGGLAAEAVAAPGTSVAFVVNNQFGGPQTIVTSSIPACSTGTVTDTSGPQATFVGSFILFSGTKLFDCGAAGTFTVAYAVVTQACSLADIGIWRVVGGTGMYAGMSGQGLVSGTYFGGQCYPNHAGVVDSYTGTVRLASG